MISYPYEAEMTCETHRRLSQASVTLLIFATSVPLCGVPIIPADMMDPLVMFSVRPDPSPQTASSQSSSSAANNSAMSDLQTCKTCGVQHSSPSIDALKNECPICLDPRQYVPATGQAWLTLADLRSSNNHKNIFHPMDADQTSYAHLIAIRTEPQVAIGQSAYLVRTPDGNVLWDCITYLDDETIEAIKGLGGLKAIVISHPHFYSTNVEYNPLQNCGDGRWAKAFNCPRSEE